MTDATWTVTVTDDATGNVVRMTKVSDERRAEKIADGLSIKLDHDRFTVTVEKEGGDE